MKRMLPIVLAVLSGSCGGKALDLGGPSSAPPGSSTPPGLSTVLVLRQRNLRSLASDGPHLYWVVDEGTGSEVRRCAKQDCTGTLQSFLMLEGERALVGLQIRGDTMYLIGTRSILSCPLAGCDAPSVVVANARPAAVVFDESNVYWSQDNAILSCPLTGCERAIASPLIGVDAWDLAIDERNFYWINPTPNIRIELTVRRTEIMWAPKDGSASPMTLATRQGQATSLVVRDGFVTWTMSHESGSIERCAAAGCAGGEPELVADRQSFPYFVNLDNAILIWMNGKGAAVPWSGGGIRYDNPATTIARRVQIVGCHVPSCATSIEVLDEGVGGDTNAGPAGWMQPRGMVVDSEAIYWIGDVVEASPPGSQPINVDASIRRLARRTGEER